MFSWISAYHVGFRNCITSLSAHLSRLGCPASGIEGMRQRMQVVVEEHDDEGA